jgi:hypothetical protein
VQGREFVKKRFPGTTGPGFTAILSGCEKEAVMLRCKKIMEHTDLGGMICLSFQKP